MHSLKNMIIVVSMGVGVLLLFDAATSCQLVIGVIQGVAFATDCSKQHQSAYIHRWIIHSELLRLAKMQFPIMIGLNFIYLLIFATGKAPKLYDLGLLYCS